MPAARFNAGKLPLRYALTFPAFWRGIAAVCSYGERKYARYNYLRGMPLSTSLDCMMRHLLAWLGGEENDPESGLSHLAHFAWNAADFVEEASGGTLTDLPRPFRPRKNGEPEPDFGDPTEETQ